MVEPGAERGGELVGLTRVLGRDAGAFGCQGVEVLLFGSGHRKPPSDAAVRSASRGR
ncbi:hypothetical protein GCM10010495_37610 [Kitasatospora herbaricolor]|nr:hypothetical protein GCM10010495_37610 [Kitasatospora herbaricolor]